MTREQLIQLVQKILDCDGTEGEVDEMIHLLEKNVPHPEVSGLIFWPEGGVELTPEQIVDKALAYKPIQL